MIPGKESGGKARDCQQDAWPMRCCTTLHRIRAAMRASIAIANYGLLFTSLHEHARILGVRTCVQKGRLFAMMSMIQRQELRGDRGGEKKKKKPKQQKDKKGGLQRREGAVLPQAPARPAGTGQGSGGGSEER